VFWKFEDTASPELKRMVVRWLRYRGSPSDAWSNQLVRIFTKIFGERHFTWKCFGRSCLASLFAVCMGIALWMTTRTYEQLMESLSGSFVSFEEEPALYPKLAPTDFAVFVVLLNCVPDYFSYMKTRVILRWMSNSDRVVHIFLFACLDTVSTVLLFAVGGLIMTFLIVAISWLVLSSHELEAFVPAFSEFLNVLVYYLTHSTRELPPLGIVFYASLFVSVWAWIYASAAFITRFIVNVFPRALPKIVWFFDVDGHPIRSFGCIAGIIVFCGALAVNEIG
jgi:hypothetical protein